MPSLLTLKVLHQPQLRRLLPKPTKRLLVSLLPQYQPSNFEVEDEDYDGGSDDIDLHRGYNRPKIITVDLDDDDVSDYVAQRLQLARERALEAYREKWA
jgi:hypothetical protein